MNTLRSRYTDSCTFFGASTAQELIKKYGSPVYVYNERILRERCRELLELSTHPGFRVYFSAKANGNLHILRMMRSMGLYVDAMSPGELVLQQAAGFTADEILYVCNNVSGEEMSEAVAAGARISLDSLSQVETFGKLFPKGRIMVRLNPGIGAGHHQKVVTAGKETKFGISPDQIPELRRLLERYSLTLTGINQHIGSLFMTPEPFLAASRWLLGMAEELGPGLEVIDFGGGFGIPYEKYAGAPRMDMAQLGKEFDALLHEWSAKHGYKGLFYIEPGRYAVAESGLVLGTVTAVKENSGTRYVGTDIGFTVLARPVMYDAFHEVEAYRDGAGPQADSCVQTIVGNICESGDILAKNRLLPPLEQGDVIALLDAGAYGYAMSSSYTQRLRPAEVLIDEKGLPSLIRRRETSEDLLRFFF